MSVHVGYVLKVYPRFSETFIVNEILELERQGAKVTIFSRWHPFEGRFHEKLSRVRADVVYLPDVTPHELLNTIARRRRELEPVKHELASLLWDRVLSQETPRIKLFAKAVELASEVRRRDIDHLHAHFASSATGIASMASRLSGVPYSFTAHAKDIYLAACDRPRLRDHMREASFVVTVCDANRAHLEDMGTGGTPVHRIYNGLDLSEFRPTARPRSDRFTILGIGRLVEKKGFDTLIEASHRLQDRGVDFRCRIVGTGPDQSALSAGIARNGLENVRLLGPLPNGEVQRELAAADVVALPARIAADGNRDALPTVLLEAIALGVPFVSTPVTGIPEIAGGDEAGRLVPPDDPDALADALQRLAESPSVLESLGRNGRRRAQDLFDVRHNVEALRHLFERSVQRASAAPANAIGVEAIGTG